MQSSNRRTTVLQVVILLFYGPFAISGFGQQKYVPSYAVARDNKAIPATANTAPTDARNEGHSFCITMASGSEYRGPIDSKVSSKAKGIWNMA